MPSCRLLSFAIIIAVVCGVEVIGTPAPVADAAPVQTCTSQNIQGFPISGDVCGGGAAPTASTASTTQLTLGATGRSGESVSASPVGLTVNVGTTSSASFATGTLVTMTVSNGRSAIWSGGCSSGGAKQKSCSLTLNTATSVTATVQ